MYSQLSARDVGANAGVAGANLTADTHLFVYSVCYWMLLLSNFKHFGVYGRRVLWKVSPPSEGQFLLEPDTFQLILAYLLLRGVTKSRHRRKDPVHSRHGRALNIPSL